MKKNISLIIAAAMLAATLSGCIHAEKDSGSEEIIIETTAETTTPMTEIDAPTGHSDKGISTIDELFGIFDYADKTTGYIADTSSEIDTAFINSGRTNVKALSEDVILSDYANGNEDTLYKFTMYNSSTAALISDETSGLYASRLTLDDTSYAVCFGIQGTTTQEEVSAYCSEGTTWDYWAFATISDAGTYILTPIIAGSEETGYWAVRPVLIMAKFDVSGMQMIWDASAGITPAETTAPAATNAIAVTTAPTTTKASNEGNNSASGGEYGVYMYVSSAKNYDDHAEGEFSFKNCYPCEIWLSDITATLNGEDVTEQFSTYICVDANSTAYENFYLDGISLKKGDQLVISGMLVNMDTSDDMGSISLPLTFE